MTKYTIKSNKIGEGMYKTHILDEKGNLMKNEGVLENGMTVKDTLYYHDIQMVPFLRHIKSYTSNLEIEVKKE